MATTMTITAETQTDSHPLVTAAKQALAPVRTQRAALESESQRAWQLVQHTTGAVLEDAPLEALLHAQERVEQIPRELAALRIREIPLERAEARAVEQAKTEIGAAIDVQRRAMVAKLDAALTAAAKVNAELLRLDARAEQVGGTLAARFGWYELQQESPECDTRLHAWRRHCRAHNVL